jgi:ubiquinone/menaquinone biosynthesis C-methylase UbiE
MPGKLIMLKSVTDYPAQDEFDPLRYYYYPFIGRLYRKRVEMCLELLPGGGGKILEVGFGSGVCLPNLNLMYQEIHGIDLHSDCKAVASVFGGQGIKARLQNGSITALPYDDDFFDAIFLISILEHLRPDESNMTFKALYRIVMGG